MSPPFVILLNYKGGEIVYFPENMTFQYFFFDTYPGCFLQVLPVALLAGLVYGVVRFKRDRAAPLGPKDLVGGLRMLSDGTDRADGGASKPVGKYMVLDLLRTPQRCKNLAVYF